MKNNNIKIAICFLLIFMVLGCSNEKKNDKQILITEEKKTCQYKVWERFVDYYDYQGHTSDIFFIVVQQDFNPRIIQLNKKDYEKNFVKNRRYVFTYEISYQYSDNKFGKFIKEDSRLLSIEEDNRDEPHSWTNCIIEKFE